MKSRIIYISFIMLFVLLGCNTDNFKLISRECTSEIKLDGILIEKDWEKAKTIYLINNKTGEIVEQDEYTSLVKTCYDKNYLYVAFVNHDPDILTSYKNRDEHLWNDDVVEVFIDTDEGLSTYIEIEISPKNIQFDSYIVDTLNIDLIETPKYNLLGLKSAVLVDGTVNNNQDTDKLWTVEIAIPLEEIGASNKNEFPINFYRHDKGEEGSGSYAWSPTLKRFHSPSRFGRIYLNK